MSASTEWIRLPFRTNATQTGPIVEYQSFGLSVRYDHMDFNGAINWVSLNFAEVLAYEVCEQICCSADAIIASDVIEVRHESPWRTQIIKRWNVAVGWHEYQQNLGGDARFKHYVIDFDDVCAVQVIAASCTVHADD